VNFPDGVEDAAQFQDAPWASFPAGAEGLWLKSFEGEQAAGDDPADAFLYQDVVGNPGVEYSVSAMFKEEAFYSAEATRLGMQFYTGGFVFIGEASLDVAAKHPGDAEWYKYSISGVAPAGTVIVRVWGEVKGLHR